jgi:hypothetical protein
MNAIRGLRNDPGSIGQRLAHFFNQLYPVGTEGYLLIGGEFVTTRVMQAAVVNSHGQAVAWFYGQVGSRDVDTFCDEADAATLRMFRHD